MALQAGYLEMPPLGFFMLLGNNNNSKKQKQTRQVVVGQSVYSPLPLLVGPGFLWDGPSPEASSLLILLQ